MWIVEPGLAPDDRRRIPPSRPPRGVCHSGAGAIQVGAGCRSRPHLRTGRSPFARHRGGDPPPSRAAPPLRHDPRSPFRPRAIDNSPVQWSTGSFNSTNSTSRQRSGVGVTTPQRTLVDLAPRLRPDLLGRIIDEGTIARRWTVASLLACTDRLSGPGRNGIRTIRPLLADRADNGLRAQSMLELRMIRILAPYAPFETELPPWSSTASSSGSTLPGPGGGSRPRSTVGGCGAARRRSSWKTAIA